MARKPRKRTLPIAHYKGSAPAFSPTEEQWKSIGGACCELSEEDRGFISEAVTRYLRDRLFEPSTVRPDPETGGTTRKGGALPVKEVVKRLEAIHKAAKGLLQELAPAGADTVEIGSIALAEITARVQSGLRIRLRHEISLTDADILFVVASIMFAAATAKHDLNQDQSPGIQTHDAWRQLALDLMDWAERRGLQVTIAEHNATSRKWSPFVEFFSRLQDALPSDAREFRHSNGSLTSALKNARQVRKARRNK